MCIILFRWNFRKGNLIFDGLKYIYGCLVLGDDGYVVLWYLSDGNIVVVVLLVYVLKFIKVRLEMVFV